MRDNYIVVGNAEISRPIGDLIDCHDRVVRFNKFYLPPHRKFTGVRATDWVMHGRHWAKKNRYNISIWRRWARECKDITGYNWLLEGKDDVSRMLVICHRFPIFGWSLPKIDAILNSHEEFVSLTREGIYLLIVNGPPGDSSETLDSEIDRLGESDRSRVLRISGQLYEDTHEPFDRGYRPSLGLVSLAAVIEHWGKLPVAVAGFGPRDKFVSDNYFTRNIESIGTHDFDAERIVLNKWEERCWIRRCDA